MAQSKKKDLQHALDPPSAAAVQELWEHRKRETDNLIAQLRDVDLSVAQAETAIDSAPELVRRYALRVLPQLQLAQRMLFEAYQGLCEQSPYGLSSFFYPGLAEYLKGRTP